MMNRAELKESLRKTVAAKLGMADGSIVISNRLKNNGIKREYISIETAERNRIVPMVYIDSVLDDLQSGRTTLRRASNEVAEVLHNSMNNEMPDVFSPLDTPDGARGFFMNRSYIQLINAEKNEEILRNVPNRRLLDLAIVVRAGVPSDDSDTIQSVLVDNKMIAKFGMDPDVLIDRAMKNTKEKADFRCKSLFKVMMEMSGSGSFEDEEDLEDIMDGDFLCVPSQGALSGAVSMAFPELLDRFAEKTGGSYFVIPSSIHEIIILQANGVVDRDAVRGIIMEVNSMPGAVPPEDFLSNNLYYWDADRKELSIA